MTLPLTLLASDHCALSKEFTRDADGRLHGSTIANMASGSSQRHIVSDVTQLQLLFNTLAANQAICCGVNNHGDTALTTRHRAAATSTLVARTIEHFSWPLGPALFAIDVDVDADGEFRDVEAVLNALESCSPWIKDALRAARPSSSSYVDGRGLRGVHVYLGVTDGQKIPELGKRLQQDQWLAGRGYVKISKSGALLVRQLADASIYQPQRLMFEAAPQLGEGVTRSIPDGQTWVVRARQVAPGRPPGYTENGLIDIAKLPALKQIELRRYEVMLAEARRHKKPEANRRAFDWHKERAAANGWSDEVAERLALAAILARDARQLSADSYLRFERAGLLTVGQILELWGDAEGQYCTTPGDALRDDLEPRHFAKAVLMTREGRRGVYSFKDGEFFAFQPTPVARVDRWSQAAIRLEGCIDYPEPMGKNSTPAANAQTALQALNDVLNQPLRYNAALFRVEDILPSEVSQVTLAMSRLGCRNLSSEGLRAAAEVVAHANTYDPWRDTIDQLPAWDRIERLDTILADVCGAPLCPALKATSRALFASIVMRQLQPGSTQGVIPVLISERQGTGKSIHFVKGLAKALGCPAVPQIAFDEPDRMSRSARMSLIAELAEMSGHGKRDVEAVKLWATNNDDVYRDLYARDSCSHLRRFTLIGTANKHELNNDETGNRRFMPVEVTQKIDPNWIVEVPQLLAEAKERYCLTDDAYGALCVEASEFVLAKNQADMKRSVGVPIDGLQEWLPAIFASISAKRPSGDVHSHEVLEVLKIRRLDVQINAKRVAAWARRSGWRVRDGNRGNIYSPPEDYNVMENVEENAAVVNPFFPPASDELTKH